jgi:hypothetical protein
VRIADAVRVFRFDRFLADDGAAVAVAGTDVTLVVVVTVLVDCVPPHALRPHTVKTAITGKTMPRARTLDTVVALSFVIVDSTVIGAMARA